MMGAILIEYKGAVPSSISRSEFNREILKPSWSMTGEYFHRKMLPLRFTKRGGKMLNYAPRRGEEAGGSFQDFRRSYTARKRRKFGHTKPLVYTGESESLAKIRDIRATSKGVRIVNHARGLNRKHPKSKVVMRDEVRRLADHEGVELTRFLGGQVERQLKAYRRQQKKRIG